MCTRQKIKRIGFLRIVIVISLSLSILSSLLSGISFAAAQGDFPKKEITCIIGFAPGGLRDIIFRGAAKTMGKYLGVPIVIMNVPGAGGARGLTQLFGSAPDGYTIGMGSAADITTQILEKRDFDNRKFTYIGRMEVATNILVVKPDSSFRSVKDFKTFGKDVRMATSNPMSTPCLASIILSRREGFPLTIIGGFPSLQAGVLSLVRGDAEFVGTAVSVVFGFLKEVRPILTIAPNRYPDFPDIPTVREIGYPDLEVFAAQIWLIAPPGVPKARVQILEDALMKGLKDPEYLAYAKANGLEPGPLGAEETTKLALQFFGLMDKYRPDFEKYMAK